MKKIVENARLWSILFVLFGFLIVLFSVIFTHRLAAELAFEEKRKVEIWAEATRQLILADALADIDFVSSIVEQNTTIPVYMVSDKDSLLFSRNVKEPRHNVAQFYEEKIANLKATTEPIEVRMGHHRVQYIYYDESLLLTRLSLFPYFQFAVIAFFVLMVFIVFSGIKRSEQDRVWVGLSRETAHQLGTPISSLMAWIELLKASYPDDTLLPEMNRDISRLRMIADRFSKIGSMPLLELENLDEVISNAVMYMQNRSSSKVSFRVNRSSGTDAVFMLLNVSLFEWLIENLCKNAIDAMNGEGQISISIHDEPRHIAIDISDTGRGMERGMYKKVFKPGFTTKTRGWGLGLSLAKRIVEEYHGGRIFVKNSVLGQGTTFRIQLKKK